MPNDELRPTTGTTEASRLSGARSVVLYCLMSLDGAVDDPGRYFGPTAGPGGTPQFDQMMEDNENAIIDAQDVVVLGRHTYDEWSGYWPTVANNPFADFINGVKKYVVTSTPLTMSWPNAEAVHRSAADLVRELKSGPGGNIGIHGSIELAQSLLRAGLVDELQLVVAPAINFPGRRLLPGADGVRRLELLSARSTPSGSLLLAYRVPESSTAGSC